MQLTQKHKGQIVAAYCIIFYLLLFYKAWNGFLLFQLQPHLFSIRFDFTSWFLMKTGLHQWLINNQAGCVAFDVVFYTLPFIYWVVFKRNQSLAASIGALMLVVNWVYILCYTMYPANSIESFTPWLLFPLLLMINNLRSFYFVFHALRYFFLFFFASAAVWKFVQEGILNLEQMSGVLLLQHKDYLASSSNWYTIFIYWLINHPTISYGLYLGATIIELSFIAGFFTRKFDRILIVGLFLFLLFDVLVMRIPYWEIGPFVITLFYSKYKIPETATKGI